MGTGALSLEVKQPGHEADHLPPSAAKVRECVQLYFHSPSMPLYHIYDIISSVKEKGKMTRYILMIASILTQAFTLHHSPPSSAKVKNAWSYTSTPPIGLHDLVLS
jgi:hypothetical protein